MKRIFDNKVFIFLLGAILFGTTGVIAGSLIARDITFDNTKSQLKNSNNQNVDNVQDAIDALYTKASSDPVFGNVISNRSVGYNLGSNNRNTDLELNKGKYFVVIIFTIGFETSNNTDSRYGLYNSTSARRNISCTNNCNINALGGVCSVGNNDNPDANSKYKSSLVINFLYYIDVVEDNTIITSSLDSWQTSPNLYMVSNDVVSAVKIN